MRNPEIEGEKCVGAVAFCTMDCLQGYWQCPLAEEAREYFTFVTKDGLFTPTRVPQGVMNATSYFQGMMMEVLGNLVGRACLIHVDDVKVIGRSVEELIVNLRAVLLRCMESGLFLAAHKLVLFAKEVKWCGKLYSGTAVRHDPERVRGLVEMRRSATVGELMKFLQATNWMRLSLPHMAEVVAPLRALVEHRLKGTSRTKRVASRRALTDGDWTPERGEAWDNSREMLMNAVDLSFRRPDDCRVLMFPDASDLFWGCCLTQVPKEELVAGLSFMDMSHEPLAFLSGVFRGSQLCWPTVDKESFAILSAFQSVPYLLWDGSNIFCDHRNLAYMFSPQSCGVTLSKAASQRLAGWRACMSQFNYVIQHIPGEDNHWGDLLSRWRVLDSEGPLVRANVIAVVAPPTGDYQMPSKGEIKDRQAAVARGQVEVATPLGTVTRGEYELYRVSYQGSMVLWVPEEERELQARLMVCGHMQDAGHRGVRATTHRLGAYCAWDNMEKDIAKFIRQCLHCTDSKAGNAVPRPLGDLVHGTEVGDVLHFDYLSLGESDAIDMGGLVDEGYQHVLVLMDDVSRFVWLEEAVSCSMEVAARSVLKWCASFGVPKAFTSDGGTHFTGQVMQMVSSRLGVVQHFGVANVSWSHGTVERMNREVLRTFRAVLSERRRPPSEWPLALEAVQWALNSAYRERMGTTPFQMMTGRPPATPMSVLAGKDGDAWTVEELDVSCEQMQSWVAGWVREQEDLRRDVVKRVREQRERVREVSGRGCLPVFEVGDFVLLARVRKPGRVPKLVQTWTGPWRVVPGRSEHVRVVEDIVTGETKEVHVVRMRPYADSSLVVGAEVREVFEMTKHQGEFEIADVISVGKDPARVGEYRVQIAWVGLEDEEPTWEPMPTVYADAPKYLEQKLRRMRLNSVTKRALKRKYDMNL